MIGRRGFITGLVSLVAAPAIVRVGSLMPVKVMIEPWGIGPMVQVLRIIGEQFPEEWKIVINDSAIRKDIHQISRMDYR